MTGELFEIKDNVLTVIALDGHRVSIRNTPLTASYDHVRTIIPGKTLSEVSKIISGDAEKNVVISFDPNYVSFRFDETLMLSRIIDGDYFRIESMLTADFDTKVTVNKKEFLRLFSAPFHTGYKKNCGVKLKSPPRSLRSSKRKDLHSVSLYRTRLYISSRILLKRVWDLQSKLSVGSQRRCLLE
mgnify:CR=1 FL=1